MTKVYQIEKRLVYHAWLKVRQNKGAAGCDGLSIQEIEADYKNHLYKLWNRMSSGSYMASPVKKVSIPKQGGKERILGIPTVMDRVAQMVVKEKIEAKLESTFHSDSFGYRPNRSAHDAIGTVRKRNWDYAWVIDLDIQNFFDSIPHEQMMEIVERRIEEKWAKLYIKRWLKASTQDEKGEVMKRTQGTPQGGVMSPLLANLYLDEVFDWWLDKEIPCVKFVRYADDSVPRAQRRIV
ncbi:group II intron reverse transcriptase/maturase [Candidatus Paracaedibacter symbiosus]|uniref:group II intron reverse transcriptase/maturase n=1 Tax=Candidatus Paracaedibacter symbiosus TaxID=244582 RepID=UPI00068CDDFB|nr:group II intron reverse transcriptase/maturase [Candidatus Paracaedibacter symbiosus]